MELVVYDLEAGSVIRRFQEYMPGAWVNDEELLAVEAQYYTRLMRLHVLNGETMIGDSSDPGVDACAPGGIFIAQMDGSGRGVTIQHWRSGEAVARGRQGGLNLLDYRWSPDGRWLASISDDGTLLVWSVSMY